MGMYNEVFHRCPQCEAKGEYGLGETQISQVILGFGGFNLSSLSSLKGQLEDKTITPDQLKRIAEYSANEWFECQENKEHTFKPDPAVVLAASLLAQRFEMEDQPKEAEDTVARAMALLHELYPN